MLPSASLVDNFTSVCKGLLLENSYIIFFFNIISFVYFQFIIIITINIVINTITNLTTTNNNLIVHVFIFIFYIFIYLLLHSWQVVASSFCSVKKKKRKGNRVFTSAKSGTGKWGRVGGDAVQ